MRRKWMPKLNLSMVHLKKNLSESRNFITYAFFNGNER